MWNKFLEYIYIRNKKFFDSKIDLETLYDDNSHFFDTLSLKEFVGYIPKNINEPALKIFEENGEAIEKWTLWQSWYVNRKSQQVPLRPEFWNGMMMYIKVLNTMSRIHKKTYIIPQQEKDDTKVETPWIDQALQGISDFKKGIEKQNENKDNKGDQSTEGSEE